jgi:hypothetical protein
MSGTADTFEAALAQTIVMGEQKALGDFVGACAKAERWDLATFLVDAGARLLPPGASPREVASRAAPTVHAEGTLRARTEARRKAGAVFYQLKRIGDKREELSLLRFFEDGYEAAQAMLAAWEVLGKDGFSRAGEVIRELEALPSTEEGNKS